MSSDYDKLRELWYKKLEKSGFKDIESENQQLKVWGSRFATKQSVQSWEAKEAYYSMATKFLNDYKFETNRERIIWEYHAEGISVRDIVKLLKKARLKRVYRRIVWETISKLENTMKKMYMLGYK